MKNLQVFPITLISLILLTFLINPTSSAITFNPITESKLRDWSYMFDNIHRFIILNQ